MSKIKCRLGLHKWKYSRQNFRVIFQLPKDVKLTKSFPPQIIPYSVRVCEHCYKKQRKDNIKWVECSLTMQENRDRLLTNLDI